MTLDDYFASCNHFGYGTKDCCLFLADWVLDQTGKDPAAGLRFGPISEEQANAVLEQHGGLPRLLDRRFRAAGMKRTSEPRDGDCGAIALNGEVIGSIQRKNQWWVLGRAGLFPVHGARLIKAWTF